MDDEPHDGKVIYAHEKSLEEVLAEITGKDPEEIGLARRRDAES